MTDFTAKSSLDENILFYLLKVRMISLCEFDVDVLYSQCTGNPQGAVTHSNTNLKVNTTVYSWIPPPNSTSPVYFKILFLLFLQ